MREYNKVFRGECHRPAFLTDEELKQLCEFESKKIWEGDIIDDFCLTVLGSYRGECPKDGVVKKD